MKKSNNIKRVIVVGPLPPPTHGSSKNLAAMVESLSEFCLVIPMNMSPGSLVRGFKYHIRKLWRFIISMIRAAFLKYDCVYMSVDAGPGVFYSLSLILIFRLKVNDLVIHHRSFAYLNKWYFPMELFWMATKPFCHVFLCEEMRDRFENSYGKCHESLVVSNANHIFFKNTDKNSHHTKEKKITTLGFISNLSKEKGFDDAVFLLKKLIKNTDSEFSLIVAGPPDSKRVKERLWKYKSELGKALDYRGPVFGESKISFFSDIDVLIFPTKYVNEAQPNVIFESLGFGVPVLTTNRGCIPSDVTSDCGAFFDEGDFINSAFNWLVNLNLNQGLLIEKKAKAFNHGLHLKNVAKNQHKALVERISSK